MGEPKQLVKVGAENLLERSVRVAHEAELSPVIVVLGASAESIEAAEGYGRDGVSIRRWSRDQRNREVHKELKAFLKVSIRRWSRDQRNRPAMPKPVAAIRFNPPLVT